MSISALLGAVLLALFLIAATIAGFTVNVTWGFSSFAGACLVLGLIFGNIEKGNES
jgi:hypothetical protein